MDPDEDPDEDPNELKKWTKNEDSRWHHSRAKEFKGIANKPNAQDSKLQKIYGELWQPQDQMPGGTARMLREEIKMGMKGKTHLQKAQDRLRELTYRLSDRSKPLLRSDRKTAERVVVDLRDAVNDALKFMRK